MSGLIQNNQGKADIIKRLKRIEGQVKGIMKMVEDEKYCVDILTQIAAIRAAINKVGGLMLEKHVKSCMRESLTSDDSGQVINDMIDTVQKFLRIY